MSEETPELNVVGDDGFTDQHPQVTEKDIQVEVTPEETKFPLYRCPRGHEQRGSGETKGKNWQTGRVVNSGPVCTECWLPSLGERFPTFKVSDE